MNRMVLLAILFFIGTVWGFTVVLMKLATSTGYGPFGLVAWEIVITIVVLGGILKLRGQTFSFSLTRLKLFLVVGLCGTVLPGAFSYRAAAELPGGVMSIVIALVPLCALPVALLMGLEKLRVKRLLGVLLGAVAVVMIVGPESALPDPSKVGFVLLALAAPLFYGFEGNFLSWKGSDGLNPIQVLAGAAIVSAVLVFPVTTISGQWINLYKPWGIVEWSLLGLAVLHIGAYSGYIWLVGQAGSIFASQVAYIVTITGVLWSIALLNEGYSLWIWAALVTLLLGVSLVLPNPRVIEPETKNL